jgi:sterol desaturase/sphingolipid hydroxylase (fatty acid hydroxylase superfamily)
MHEVRALWAIHVVHHSSEHFALRGPGWAYRRHAESAVS